ncbi:MAG: glycosyltransferase family 2 protein [Endomicrobiaceae bacterium]|nr:glycosyltransferase family 2 protein [Endomicrobiaceae bacterium]
MKISLVMITKNEENNLRKSLLSVVDLVDEMIVVDSGSTDGTVNIAKDFGAIVEIRNFDSFTNQKNYALSLANNEWVLHLDADEFMSNELKQEIKQTLENTDSDAFYLVRTNYFLGRQMKHAGLAKENRLRLAKKSLSRYTGGLIHEELVVNGKTGYMKNSFKHHPYPTLDNFFSKFDQYTTLGAMKMHERNKKFHITDVVCRPILEFFKRYVFRLGLLDGLEGFVWAVFGMFYVFAKYIKLWQLKNKKI